MANLAAGLGKPVKLLALVGRCRTNISRRAVAKEWYGYSEGVQ